MKKLSLLIMCLFLVSCASGNTNNNQDNEVIDNNNDNTIVEPPPVVYQSKFDGRDLENNEPNDARIFAVMFDNAPGARPQAGLSKRENSLRDTGRKCRDSVYGHF